jgi:hypothetical protein
MGVDCPTPTFSLTPQDFLDTVSGYTQATAPDTSANKPVKLATVMVLGASNTVQVQFDGETVTSTKYYPCLAQYKATVGDRVALLPSGTTYVVLGSVGATQALSGTTLTTTGDATIGGNISANNFKVNTNWALLSSVGSFQNSAAAGTRPPRVRSITMLGTTYWEMAGEIDLSSYTGGAVFSFTGGSSSVWAPTREHDWAIVGGAATGNTSSQRMYWAPSGNVGFSPSPATAITYVSLDPIRIVDPKNQIT